MDYSFCSIHKVPFGGKIIETSVTNMASAADHWLRKILHTHKLGEKIIVGLDCKFNSHHPIRSMNKIVTLQLCIGTKCLILQLLHMDFIPLSLKKFFDNSGFNVTFFGLNIDDNVLKLWRDHGLKCSKKIDIRAAVKIWFPMSGSGEMSLKGMAYEVARLSMRKRKQKCCVKNWESSVLDEEMVEIACVDAYVTYVIATKLLEQ